uniref:Ultraviolet-B-repressible protein n=1 Tax=Ananas comosus var. bracteatus TaxID=296719 RepID=A0A6V7P384_ANACO|nr:unnamed protein product [Ananas comosus var. bracteatus]
MASALAPAIASITAAPRRALAGSAAFFNPTKLSAEAGGSYPRYCSCCRRRRSLAVSASSPPSGEDRAVAGMTALALAAALVIPEVAEAAQPGLSPSLKNFLLSIVSGGVVLGALVGAVIGVANFDPVKRV